MVLEKAVTADLAAITRLLEGAGLPVDGVAEHLESIVVARHGSAVVGCAGLELYSRFALLRSVAVASALRGSGLGQRLTRAALELARSKAVEQVFLLTTTASGFFPRFGFEPVDRGDVPAEVQQSVEFQSSCPASALAMRKRFEANQP